MTGQFFFNPMNGAIAYSILFLVVRQLSGLWLRLAFPSLKALWRFLLSLALPAVLWCLAMVPQIPLTVTMAVILVLGAGCALMALPQAKRPWAMLPAFPVMYWLAGPAAVLLVLCRVRWMPATVAMCAASLVGSACLTNYPLRQVARGIDYYDFDEDVGKLMGTYEEMECDMLFRQGEWHEIIRRFPQPESPAVRSAVLIAYHKTGQLGRQELMNNLVIPREPHGNSLSVFNIGDAFFVVNFGSLSSAFMVSDMAHSTGPTSPSAPPSRPWNTFPTTTRAAGRSDGSSRPTSSGATTTWRGNTSPSSKRPRSIADGRGPCAHSWTIRNKSRNIHTFMMLKRRMRTLKTYSLFRWLPVVLLVLGCQSRPADVRQADELPAIWPDYTGVTIPATIAPLNFAMADDAFETVDVTVCAEKDGQWTQYRDFQVYVSADELDAWGITYRRIPPSYEI